MIFQDCAVTTGMKSKIFHSFYCQKFVAKQGGVYNVVLFHGISIIESKCMRSAKTINQNLRFWCANGGHFTAYFHLIRALHYMTNHLCSS